MLITHTQPREDLNDGKPHNSKPASALHVLLALQQVRAGNPIKTLKVPK